MYISATSPSLQACLLSFSYLPILHLTTYYIIHNYSIFLIHPPLALGTNQVTAAPRRIASEIDITVRWGV
jgi:hypothetical protein